MHFSEHTVKPRESFANRAAVYKILKLFRQKQNDLIEYLYLYRKSELFKGSVIFYLCSNKLVLLGVSGLS